MLFDIHKDLYEIHNLFKLTTIEKLVLNHVYTSMPPQYKGVTVEQKVYKFTRFSICRQCGSNLGWVNFTSHSGVFCNEKCCDAYEETLQSSSDFINEMEDIIKTIHKKLFSTLNTHRIWKPEIGELCYFWEEWGDELEYNHYPIIGTFKCIDKSIDYYICNELPDDSFPVCTPYLGETFWC